MKTFYIKCTHLFKTKEAAVAAGISPWDMWEVTKNDDEQIALITPVQVGPPASTEPPPEPTPEPCNDREALRRHRRHK